MYVSITELLMISFVKRWVLDFISNKPPYLLISFQVSVVRKFHDGSRQFIKSHQKVNFSPSANFATGILKKGMFAYGERVLQLMDRLL
jgi:hypothetical protein